MNAKKLSVILAAIAGIISLGAGVRGYMRNGAFEVVPLAAGVLLILAAFLFRSSQPAK